MRIDVVGYNEDEGYLVFFFPNKLEFYLFGIEPKAKRYRPTGKYYVYADLPSYYRENGTMTGPWDRVAKAIEKFKHSRYYEALD